MNYKSMLLIKMKEEYIYFHIIQNSSSETD